MGERGLPRPDRQVSYVRAALKGMALTFKHMLQPKVTMQYPEQKSTETYTTPMRWTLRWLERNRHPLIASTLRFMGMQGSTTFSVTCQTCSGSVTLPDEYAEAIARDALNLAWEHYREAPTTV